LSFEPAIAVVVPARNAEATLAAALVAIEAQELDGDFEVIVVDDGSSDATAAIAAAAGANVRLVGQAGLGPGPARNLGAAQSRAPVLVFVDADCVPAPQWLAEGLTAMAANDLVQGRVVPDPSTPLHPFDHTIWVLCESPLYESANLFVRRELFDRVGGFEDWLGARIGKPLAEDVWFGWRARRAGARIAFAPRALVHHAVIARGPRAYIAERMRLAYFPAIVAKVPELRRDFLFARVFLTRGSASFDLAAAGIVAAVLSSSTMPLLTFVPYASILLRRALPHRRTAPWVATADILADAVGFAALVLGSVRWRCLVL